MLHFFDHILPAIGVHVTSGTFALVVSAFLIALLFSIILTPLAIKAAMAAGVVDAPNEARRVHTKPTPRWGGLAMFAAFTLTVLLITPLRRLLQHENMLNPNVIGILIGGALMTLVGALDDKFNIPAKVKLLGQLLAASVAVFVFHVKFMVAFGYDLNSNLVGALLSVLFIVAITNTINLIDGLDGLAAGISGIAALTFVIISVAIKVTIGEAILAAAVVGACLGFLRYNFNPAKVFMGDAGSHFLGFTIAVLAILQNWKVATGVAFTIPVLVLAVPIFDTAFAILRRLSKRQPIFSPDKGHLHHRLLNLGLHQRTVVLTIYLLTAVGCALALLLTRTQPWK